MAKTISQDAFRHALVLVVGRQSPDDLLALPGVEELLSRVLYEDVVKAATSTMEDDGEPEPGTPEADAALAARPDIEEED